VNRTVLERILLISVFEKLFSDWRQKAMAMKSVYPLSHTNTFFRSDPVSLTNNFAQPECKTRFYIPAGVRERWRGQSALLGLNFYSLRRRLMHALCEIRPARPSARLPKEMRQPVCLFIYFAPGNKIISQPPDFTKKKKRRLYGPKRVSLYAAGAHLNSAHTCDLRNERAGKEKNGIGSNLETQSE
jgi:hypothetical protein